jgi:rare lipoprotein A
MRITAALGSVALLLSLLAGCAGTPPSVTPAPAQTAAPTPAPTPDRDGPPSSVPPDLQRTPDAEPRVEPIRSGGPNKPYEVLSQRYTPLTVDEALVQSGLASWYGRKFHGRPTASGEIYDMFAMSGAHRTMPIPSYARVLNPANGQQIVVRINDRGPFHADRIIDLSYTAALKLGVLGGVTPVQVQRLTHDDIRSGRWRSDFAAAPAVAPIAAPADAPADTPAAAPALAAATAPAEDGAAPARAAAGFWLQLGAFRQRHGAFELRAALTRELDWLEPLLAIFSDSGHYRVQAGPYASRAEALSAATQIRLSRPAQPLLLQRR